MTIAPRKVKVIYMYRVALVQSYGTRKQLKDEQSPCDEQML